jgi:hypothetical protein
MNMKPQLNFQISRIVSTLLCGTALVACGGGADQAPLQSVTATSGPRELAVAPPPVAPLGTPSTTTTTPTSAAITDVRIENTDTVLAQTRLPFTFGQAFVAGDLKPADVLGGRFDDGSTIPLQVDVKATNPDGSVRHAIISGVVPTMVAGAVRTMKLVKTNPVAPTTPATPASLLSAGFTASVNVTIGGVAYAASADQLLATGTPVKWLTGAVANEWEVSMPLTTAAGVQHPHLTARFAVRYYEPARKARVDVTIENDWAYEPAPQNFSYDAQVLVGGKTVYTKAGLNHLHHARWRKLFWWNTAEPTLNLKHNTAYLIASRALPNFDQTISVPESGLAALKAKWTGAITEPMAVGLADPYMPGTGGRGDIGLLPSWEALYLLSMDKRAREVTLGTADLAGSWSIHYRDRTTGRPINLMDHPYMTVVGGASDTFNPVTKKYEAFPSCASAGACTTPNTQDTAHQPNFAYLPYLVTGDHYYLEELQFWAMYNGFSSNPGYRSNIKGLFQSDQVRGQGWSLRTVAEAAYISPDTDPLKPGLASIVTSNLEWYNSTYTNNPSANGLGALVNGYALGYLNSTALAPWQDDFFTSAVGHTAELGFAGAAELLAWKAKFPIQRMTGDGACWISATDYNLVVRDNTSSPIYNTIGQAYRASHTPLFNALACAGTDMAAALGLAVGEMVGYSAVATGYPANMQPALAYSADTGAAGKAAWQVFATRSSKPNYSTEPQFAIVPR